MYKYKPVRYIFRLLNLIIYAAVISFSVIAIRDDLCITDFMTTIFKNNLMDSKRSLYLAIFLLANVCIILLLRRWTKGYTIKQPNMDCQPTEITALMRHRAVFS